MKDTRWTFILVGMGQALTLDRLYDRHIAGGVIGELSIIKPETISNDPETAAKQANEWVNYSYGLCDCPK